MISPEVWLASRRLELKSRRRLYRSRFGAGLSSAKGKGLEFDEVRQYQPGDETRDIDWKVTARRGSPYVKRFVEERQRAVWLVLDDSASMRVDKDKWNRSIETLALIGLAASIRRDRVGWFAFGSSSRYRPARLGRSHVLGILADMLEPPRQVGEQTRASLTDVVRKLHRTTHGKGFVVVVSDYLLASPDVAVAPLKRRHDVTAVHVCGREERMLSTRGLVRMRDSESGEVRWIDTCSERVRREYAAAFARRREAVETSFRHRGVDYLYLPDDVEMAPAVLAHFGH